MQFVFPNFLWALFFLAIPIIIHLFYFRRFKRVYFTNVKFLKEVKEETSSRNKLKNLLILLARLLALAMLIFAFAQPYIPSSDQKNKGKKAVSIYIDNSFSMTALTNDVSLLNKAKQKAQEILSAYNEDDGFQILSNNFSSVQQRILTKEEALSQIDVINQRPEVYPLSQVLQRQRQALNQGNFDTKIFYQISDFQKNITDNIEIQDSTEELNLIPLQSIQDINVSIDSCWFATKVPMANQNNQLVISLTNHSNEDRDGIRTSMNYNDENRPLGLKSIKANTTILDTVSISISEIGWNTADINIVDFPITFDDNYKIAFEVKDQIRVLNINESKTNVYLNALFNGIQYIQAVNQEVNNVNYSNLKDFQLIILNDIRAISSGLTSAINDYVENGGNVLVFPNRNADIESYNRFLGSLNSNTLGVYTEGNKTVGTINIDEYIFKDVFDQKSRNIKLPKVTGTYSLNTIQSRGEEVLLSYRDGSSYIGKYAKGSGHVYLCSAPINTEVNDLVQNAEIFVPMLFKMSISSSNNASISYTIGKNRVISVNNEKDNNDIVYKIISDQEFIPNQVNAGNQIILNMGDNITKADFYDVKLNERLIKKLAYNYNNLESELSYFSAAELLDKFGENANIFSEQLDANFTEIIEEKDKGKTYWKWCIIASLLFLGIEQLLLRIWRN